jgi:hypothetical protein
VRYQYGSRRRTLRVVGGAPINNYRRYKMKEFLLQTYTVVLPILLGYIVWLLKQQKKDKDANSKGTMLLLRVQLIEYHDKYMKLGEIPSYAYDNFVEMYNAYHALGGNGMVTKMYDEIQEIHLKNGGKD